MKDLIDREAAIDTARAELDGGTPGGFLTVLNLLMSTSCRVLIEHFGWPSMARSANRRYRTARFCELLVDEVNRIISDDSVDIRAYNEQTLKMYGIQFFTEKPEEEA